MENVKVVVSLENDHFMEIPLRDDLSKLLKLKMHNKVFSNESALHKAITDHCKQCIRDDHKLIKNIEALYNDALDRNLNGVLYSDENSVANITPPFFMNLLTIKTRKIKREILLQKGPFHDEFCRNSL